MVPSLFKMTTIKTLKRKVEWTGSVADFPDVKKRRDRRETLTTCSLPSLSLFPPLLLDLPFDLVAHVLTFLLPTLVHDSFTALQKELAVILALMPQISRAFHGWFPQHLVRVALRRFQPTLGTPLMLTRLRLATGRTAVVNVMTSLNYQVNAWLAEWPYPEIFYGKAHTVLLLPPPALDMLTFYHHRVGRNREGLSATTAEAAWLALVVNGPVGGWSTAEDRQLHTLHRPARVVAWEEIRRLKLERKKAAVVAQRAARAESKRSLHSFLKTHPKLSIVAVRDTPTYHAVWREPWPSVVTPEWQSEVEIRFLKDIYWHMIGAEIRTLEHQINWALECLYSTLFGPTLDIPQQTFLVTYHLTNTLVGVADDLLASFLATGNVRTIASFAATGPGGLARTTAENLLQRIERVLKLAMEIQGPEPWYKTAQKKVQLDLELSWLQLPATKSDWDVRVAWEETVYSHIVPLGVDPLQNWEDVVQRLQDLPVALKLRALRLHNSHCHKLAQLLLSLMRASAKLNQLVDAILPNPEHNVLVQKARQVLVENGADRLKLIQEGKQTIRWWTNVIDLACVELKAMSDKLTDLPKRVSAEQTRSIKRLPLSLC